MSDLPIYACSSQNSMNIWVLSLQQKHYCTTWIFPDTLISRKKNDYFGHFLFLIFPTCTHLPHHTNKNGLRYYFEFYRLEPIRKIREEKIPRLHCDLQYLDNTPLYLRELLV